MFGARVIAGGDKGSTKIFSCDRGRCRDVLLVGCIGRSKYLAVRGPLPSLRGICAFVRNTRSFALNLPYSEYFPVVERAAGASIAALLNRLIFKLIDQIIKDSNYISDASRAGLAIVVARIARL